MITMEAERRMLGIETVRVEDLSSVLDNIPVVKNVRDLEALGIVETVGYIEPIGFINQKGSLEKLNITPRQPIENVGIVKKILPGRSQNGNNLRMLDRRRYIDDDMPEPVISPDNPAAFHFLGNTKSSGNSKTFTSLKPVVNTDFDKSSKNISANKNSDAFQYIRSLGYDEKYESSKRSQLSQNSEILKHRRTQEELISSDNPAAFHFNIRSKEDIRRRELLVEEFVKSHLSGEHNPAAFHFMPSTRSDERIESNKYMNPIETVGNTTYTDLSRSQNSQENTIYIRSENPFDSAVEVIDYVDPIRIQEKNNNVSVNMKNYSQIIEDIEKEQHLQSMKQTNLGFYDALKIVDSLNNSQNENNVSDVDDENQENTTIENLPKSKSPHKISITKDDKNMKNEQKPVIQTMNDKLKPKPLPDNKNNIETSNGEKRFKCETCGHETNHKGNFKKHLLIHSGQKPFACDYCGYRCFYKHYLEIHMLFHKGVKPYSCEQCGTKFTAKCDLTRHMKIHTQEKHHSCTFCDYKTSRKSYLKVHMRSHTGEKPYECTVCGKKFSQKNNMKQHYSVIHDEQTLHKCTDCKKEFTKKEQLMHHRRLNHLNSTSNINMMNRK
ncbi:unnamed protein product [Meganyctiphanes norvegica]|uniref:C2H2-type domain-containing protein n=1 Tax=Meganyctiphanes norvegica TaxID=48144 RepID=A0AAV2R3T9_MEGNR